MAWPPIVADSLAGALFGGPCWGKSVVAAARRPAQTKIRFMGASPLGRAPLMASRLDATIVAPRTSIRKERDSGSEGERPAMMRRKDVACGWFEARIGGRWISAGGQGR